MDATPTSKPIVTDSYADVNGVRLHYVGSGQGKLILFLHGFPEFWYAWKDQLAEFGRDHQAVAFDMRGYNLSSKPEDVREYRLKKLVDDVRALAEHLGHEKFVLVGHDWGGLIAWIFGAHYPECIEKLIILNAPHPAVFERELRENPVQRLASSYFELFSTPRKAEEELSKDNFALLTRIVLEEGISQGYRTEEDSQKYIGAWSQPGALTGGLNYYRANRLRAPLKESAFWSATDAMPELSSTVVRVPTLVVWGLRDSALPTGNLSGLDRFVANLTVRLIPDAGHWVIQQKVKEVNQYIREFLEGTQTSADPRAVRMVWGSASEIHATQQKWLTAIRSRNIEQLIQLVTDDVVVIHPNGKMVRGISELRADFHRFFEQFSLEQSAQSEETVVAGEWGFDISTITSILEPKDGGAPKHISSKVVVLLRQTDGQWRIARLISVTVP